MTSPDLEHSVDYITSFDGAVIAIRRMGEGSGIPLLVVNAVGANMASWRAALEPMASDGPIVMWDLRGTFESGPPETPRYDSAAHAEDAITAMDHLGFDRFVVASWSSGGRIAMEIAHNDPERIAALALVSAGYGYPLTRLLRYIELPVLLPVAAGVARRFAGPLQGALRGLVTRPELAGIVRQSGLISADADIGALVELVEGVAACDLKILLTSYEAVVGDPAASLLQEIPMPVLLAAGDKDQFTSRRMLEEMEGSLPDVRRLEYRGATHFLPVEQPEALARDLRGFFAEAV